MPTVLETSSVPGLRFLYRLSLVVMAVDGFFCIAFVAILLLNYSFFYRHAPETTGAVAVTAEGVPIFSSDPSYRQPAADSFNVLPTDNKEFLELKRRLSTDKQNEILKDQVRQLDLELRLDFFKRREIIAKTSPFLLGALLVFLAATWTARVLKRKIPIPQANSQDAIRLAESNRLSLGTVTVFAFFMMLVGLAFGLTMMPRSPFEDVLASKLAEESRSITQEVSVGTSPAGTAETEIQSIEEEAPLDREAFLEEAAKNWPSFRGFDGSGVAQAIEPPPPIR